MKNFLSELGFESRGFDRGEDALNAVKGGNVSFVITGLEMVDMKGEEMIKQIASLPNKPPIFVVTGNDNPEQSERLKALGVNGIVLKSGGWKEDLGRFLR